MQTSRVIFITGAASGIGKWLAEHLYRQGHQIVATDLNEAGLQILAQANQWADDRTIIQKQDVTSIETWQALLAQTLQKFGKLDVLLNVAGVCQPGLIYETEMDKVHSQIDINLKGTIYGSKLAAELMVKQKSGHIINIASIAGIVPAWGFNLYNAAKFGVRGFTLAIAYELAEHNVNVTVVCPDAVETPMVKGMETNRAAAMVFGGSRTLTVDEIGQAIVQKALIQKKLEVVHTVGNRGWLVRLGGLVPRMGLSKLAQKIRQKGWAAQEKRKRSK
ncbi:MAG: SDR family oxidoreductase [Microscillaceae bacterium]|nr:SDR family oxidoreductase [Microscillaceae bacterium]